MPGGEDYGFYADTTPPRPGDYFPDPFSADAQPPEPRFVPESLDVFMREEAPRPAIIDGLLYPAKLHTLSGPPESGKTLLALRWAIAVMKRGGNVLAVDQESGPVQTAALLTALGADPELTAKRMTYLPFPAASWRGHDLTALDELVRETRPVLSIWDSCAALMAGAGLDENSAVDTTTFLSTVLLPLSRIHQCSTILIDHDNKTSSEASRYARGSGAKLAVTDVALKVSPLRPFSRQQDGLLKLTVSKDREGWLHRSWRVRVTHDPLHLDIMQDTASEQRDGMSAEAAKLASVLTEEPSGLRSIIDRLASHYGHGLRWGDARKTLNQLVTLGIADTIPEQDVWMRAGAWKPPESTWRPSGQAEPPF